MLRSLERNQIVSYLGLRARGQHSSLRGAPRTGSGSGCGGGSWGRACCHSGLARRRSGTACGRRVRRRDEATVQVKIGVKTGSEKYDCSNLVRSLGGIPIQAAMTRQAKPPAQPHTYAVLIRVVLEADGALGHCFFEGSREGREGWDLPQDGAWRKEKMR